VGNDFLLTVTELVHGRKVAGKERPWTRAVFLQEPFPLLHLIFQAHAISCTEF